MTRTACTALLLVISAAAAGVSIRYDGGVFQVTGWNAAAEPAGGWGSIFTVSTGSGDVPPMLGNYSVVAGTLTFQPRWPVAQGLRVHASFHLPGAPAVETDFAPQATHSSAPSARIDHVYPSSSVLPENALRLYIYFSVPMRRGEAWQHIRLLDEKGNRVELPFLEIDQELWDPGNTRLTVLFDPGRIKRGLIPLRDSGPNIVEGRHYTLVIGKDWRDANGQPLVSDFSKPFRVVEPFRAALDPAQWRITAPSAGGRDLLVVAFPRPLDYALALRTISVPGVTGIATLNSDETEWRFTPDAPWKQGDIHLAIDTALEDVAGNRIGRAFDVDTFTEVTRKITAQTVLLPFRVGPR
jgi:hypothetical protein